jgi:hypothetical protein
MEIHISYKKEYKKKAKFKTPQSTNLKVLRKNVLFRK